jgi:hypothetical protein
VVLSSDDEIVVPTLLDAGSRQRVQCGCQPVEANPSLGQALEVALENMRSPSVRRHSSGGTAEGRRCTGAGATSNSVSAALVASVVPMVVLVLMAALVPSVSVATPFPVMLACCRGSGSPLNAARSYDTHAPGRTRPDEQGEYNEQRKQLLCDGWAHLISQDR